PNRHPQGNLPTPALSNILLALIQTPAFVGAICQIALCLIPSPLETNSPHKMRFHTPFTVPEGTSHLFPSLWFKTTGGNLKKRNKCLNKCSTFPLKFVLLLHQRCPSLRHL